MAKRLVRLDDRLMQQLDEYKRLTQLPLQILVENACKFWLEVKGPTVLQAWGVTAKEIDRISQMRYSEDLPKKHHAATGSKKKALA